MVSILASDKRKRATSAPGTRPGAVRSLFSPDPWECLAECGDRATRSASSLAELAVQTNHLPELWALQNRVAESVCHEILAASSSAWKNGIAHGKWLAAQEVQELSANAEKLTQLQSKLYDTEVRLEVLSGQYEEAKRRLRQISGKENDGRLANGVHRDPDS